MSTANEIASIPDRESEPISRWHRARGFGLGPFGEKWWIAPLNKDRITPIGLAEIPVTANGTEVVEVLDVTDGTARYRRYLLNPDGEIVRVSFAPQYDNIWSVPDWRLRGIIKRMKMVPAASGGQTKAPAEKQRASAQIIQFPRSRIVRLIVGGQPVDAAAGNEAA